MRIAVLDRDRCQPARCSLECIKFCPGVRMGDETIVIEGKGKPRISEELCTGCGICIHKCPFEAISIVNLPDELSEELIHQYGANGFRFYRLPHPQMESVVGLIGQNGIGKTSILKTLSGELIPNLGGGGGKEEVIERFAGTQFQEYFVQLYEGGLKTVHKPQYVDGLPKVVKGTVAELLEKADETGRFDEVVDELQLSAALEQGIDEISGGELQRTAIAAALLRDADVYFFDEPSSYLDVRQRLNMARAIRGLLQKKRVVVVEHDLVVLDYLADYVHGIYGKPGAYGIVSQARTVRKGINAYLSGFYREENIRFRKDAIRFEVRPPSLGREGAPLVRFEPLKKSYNGFTLEVEGGEVREGEVIGILGPNATGKTTFVKMLAGVEESDSGKIDLKVTVAYKPQYITPEPGVTVREALSKASEDFPSDEFLREIGRPLEIETLLDAGLDELSGGELQRVAIAAALLKEADIYLFDEPSAYLDIEQRMAVARLLRRFIENRGTTGMVVDHDILFMDYISDRLMVFAGEPGVHGSAARPGEMREGMNKFLKDAGVTFRRDPETGRPRANKPESQKDRAQKKSGEYYYT
ncbi:MAG: ribosome biogenesis/translation initiation ATPase RLI [Methanobacteriota archaeon]|nr:MAG: ribosome biogenesis/translation initiation ATPase RLI [Euryarchaeota archaeon]